MASSILLLVAVIILADLVIITLLAFRANRTAQKVEMLCDTLEKTLNNALEEPISKVDDLHQKLTQAEDHLRTINKNIYILASQIVQQEERETD
jgi:cell shape-determining protein MreC